MKLCIFPGTFNPIHKAHLRIAEFVCTNFGFDEVIFVPAYKPPHKSYDISMSYHRLNMVKLAIEKYPKFSVSDIEFQREGKSYTYLTILELYQKYKVENKINLIIGTDAFKEIESWYETDKLKEIVDFIVFNRENNPVNLKFLKDKGYNFKLADLKFLDISSTDLRQKIANNEDVSEFLSDETKRYIYEHGLYKNQ